MDVRAATPAVHRLLTRPGQLAGRIGEVAADFVDLVWDRLDAAETLAELLDGTRTVRARTDMEGREVAYVDVSSTHRLIITPLDGATAAEARIVGLSIRRRRS
jgi:hypothetical protein